MASHLPSVANFHSSVDMAAAGCIYGQAASQLNGLDSSSGASSQTGDALGKALASVCSFSADDFAAFLSQILSIYRLF